MTARTDAASATGTVSALSACATAGARCVAAATARPTPIRAAIVNTTSATSNDCQPVAVPPPAVALPDAEYQSRKSDTNSATPAVAAIHSPWRSLRRSIAPGSVALRPARDPRLHAGGRKRVLQQHRDRHLADAAGHRSDRPRLRLDRLEVDVALEAVVGAVHADVDHRHAVLHHLSGHELGHADGRDDHVCAATRGGEVARA